MTADLDAMVPRPSVGRVYERDQVVRLADVGVDGRARLDAIARWLQDVATDDRVDAAGDGRAVSDAAGAGFVARADRSDGSTWVLRRNRLALTSRPRFVDRVRLATWCSGVGSRWAERRTDVVWGDGTSIRSAALWVHLDEHSRRPAPLPARFDQVWAPSAAGRRVRARLAHDGPSSSATPTAWPLRSTDVDVLGHVNNAVYWSAFVEILGAGVDAVDAAELEFRGGIDLGEVVTLRRHTDGPTTRIWWCVGDEVRASGVAHSAR